MKIGRKDASKKMFLRPGVNLREVTMKYGSLVACIRHGSAEVWGFRYGLTLGIGTLKNNDQHLCFRACSWCSQTLY